MHKRTVTVDFSKPQGRVKPLGGMCGGPKSRPDLSIDFTDEFQAMSVPFVRTHNVEAPYGGGRFVDIHCIFPDPELDPRFGESYNFAPTDEYFASIKAAGAEIFLRLGESSDPYEAAPFIRPPKNPAKLAEICIGILRHYNEGWANGFKYGIKYVEIWSDADEEKGFRGEREEYFELYSTVARALKARFPRLQVGAYSSGGFYSLNHPYGAEKEKTYPEFLEAFLAYIGKKSSPAPLDFLSWKCYADSPEELSLHANYARSYLQNASFKKAKSIVSEFNLRGMDKGRFLRREYPAELASAYVIAEKANIDMMFYESASPFSLCNGLFSLDDRVNKRHYAAYEAVKAFGEIYRTGSLISTSEDYRREIYSLAAGGRDKAEVLLVTRNYSGIIELSLRDCPCGSYTLKGIIGGGERGAGFSTEEKDIPLVSNKITLKTGNNEIYLISFI